MSMTQRISIYLITLLFPYIAFTQDWSVNAELPGEKKCFKIRGVETCLSDGNRANIYNFSEERFLLALKNGSKHTLFYPVKSTGLKLPFESLKNYFNSESDSLLRRLIQKTTKMFSPFKSLDELFDWIGLNKYPKNNQEHGPNYIANMGDLQKYPMGTTIEGPDHAKYMTFSCAACHSANLFGTKVLGMTNRFPRANEVFITAKKGIGLLPTFVFQSVTGANREETLIYKKAKDNIRHIGIKRPLNLGLDTSLAQVGLSLSMRSPDQYATKSSRWMRNPRKSPLTNNPADSKPAVWWNLKYKTKWLSDGSIISGNPIYTNFLWNEIGRGVDLKKLENWFQDNNNIIKDLTAYVFAAKSPKYNKFFPNEIDIELAKEGQRIFRNNCIGCHGDYVKGWEDENVQAYDRQLETTRVWYHTKTKVVNVGTDLNRAKGMKYFAKDLNRLKISKTIGTVVKPQLGYIPPPLVGIWARWPYFHNNSVPSLYDVLTPDYKRPSSYIATAADDPETDFDKVKNGYPAPDLIRSPFNSDKDYKFDTKRKGMSNKGHTTRILIDEDGNEKFDHEDKIRIIEFLKTL